MIRWSDGTEEFFREHGWIDGEEIEGEYSRRLEIYKGKAKGMTEQAITEAWFGATKPGKPLRSFDFSEN